MSVERVRVQVMLNVAWYISVGDFSVGRVILETSEVAGQRVVDEGRVLRNDNISIIANSVTLNWRRVVARHWTSIIHIPAR